MTFVWPAEALEAADGFETFTASDGYLSSRMREPQDILNALEPLVKKMLHDAWEEGHDAGMSHGRDLEASSNYDYYYMESPYNPYNY